MATFVRWEDVSSAPDFQKLTPLEQQKVKDHYRNAYLKDLVPAEKLGEVQSIFDKEFGVPEATLLDRAGDLAGRFNRGVLGAASGIVNAANIAGAAVESAIRGETLAPNQMWSSAADAIDTNRFTTSRPEFNDSFVSDVAGGLGSGLGMALPGGALGRGARLAVGTGIGSASMASSAYDEAISKGATVEEATRLAALNAPLGITEAIPIERIVSRIPGFDGAKNVFVKMLQDAGVSGTEEGVQEFSQNVASQALEVDAGLRDKIDWNEAGYNSLVGVGSGAGLSLGTSVGAIASSQLSPFEQGRKDAGATTEIAKKELKDAGIDVPDKPTFARTPELQDWINDETTQQGDLFNRTARGVGIQDMFSGDINSADVRRPDLEGEDAPVRTPERQAELESEYLFQQQERQARSARLEELARRELALPAANVTNMGVDNIANEIAARGGNAAMADALARAGAERATGLLNTPNAIQPEVRYGDTRFEGGQFFPNATGQPTSGTPPQTVPQARSAVQSELDFTERQEPLGQDDLFSGQEQQRSMFDLPVTPVKPAKERVPDGSDLMARLQQVKQQLNLSGPAVPSMGQVESFSDKDFERARTTSNSIPVLGMPLRQYQSGNLNLGTILDDVANNPAYNKVPETRALSGVVKEMASKMAALDVPIIQLDLKNPIHKEIVANNKWKVNSEGKVEGLSGVYVPDLDAILLNQDTPNIGVVLHEARHAMTYGAISLGMNGKLTGESAKSFNTLNLLVDQFTPDISSAIDNLDLPAGAKASLKYGLTNLHEFTSELYSNPRFREVLKSIPISRSTSRELSGITGFALSKLRNMYDAVRSSIQKMLNLSDKAMNALDVLAQADENFTRTITKEQRESKAFKGPAPRSLRVKETIVPNLTVPISGDALDAIPSSPNNVGNSIKETWIKYMRSGGIAPRKLNEIRDNSDAQRLANTISSTASRRNLDKVLESYPQEAKDELNRINKMEGEAKTTALGKLGQKYPKLEEAYSGMRREINANSVKLIEGLLNGGNTLTPLEINIITSTLDRLGSDSYNTVSYRLNAPRSGLLNMKSWNNVLARSGGLTPWGIAQKQVLEGINAWTKKVGWDLGGATISEDKKRLGIINKAIDFLAKVDLNIPDDIAKWDPKEMKGKDRSRLVNLHEAYLGIYDSFDEISNAKLIEDLVKAKEVTPASKVQNMAKQMVVDILNLGNPDTVNKITKYYKSSTQDLSVITPREDVPKPIRELMGEWEDAAHNLFTTMVRQGEWISRNKGYMEMRETGEGTVFFSTKDRNETVATEELNSREYGALQGMYTTPAIKQWLDGETQKRVSGVEIYENLIGKKAGEAMKSALIWGWETGIGNLSAWNKWTVTVGNLAGTAMNFMGAPSLLLRDGNYSPTSWAKGMKIGIELIGLARRGTTREEVLEVVGRGLVDSVQAGEISNAQVEQLLKDLAPDSSFQDFKKSAGQFFTDIFAISDAWTRVANYYNQKDLISKVYEASGQKVSNERIEREAAERVRQTNMSYIRSTKLAKAIENKGGMFVPYMWEVFRTTVTGAQMAVEDYKRSMIASDPKVKKILRNHAIGRGLGIATAHGVALLGAGTVGQILSYIVSGGEGESPEENPAVAKVVNHGVPEYLRGKFLHMIGRNSDGHMTFIDAGRADPIGPVNEFAASMMSGDPDKMTDAVQNLMIVNSLYGKLLMPLVTDSAAKPGWNKDFPEMYKSLRTYIANSGLSPQSADKLMRASETFLPKTGITALGTAVNYFYADRDQPGISDGWQAMGQKLTIYNPLEAAAGAAKYEYLAPMEKERGQLREYIKTMAGGSGEPEAIERMYLATLAADIEGRAKLVDNIEAAKSAGATRRDLMLTLEKSGVSQLVTAEILRGSYKFNALNNDTLFTWMDQELAPQDLTRSERQAIMKKHELFRASIRNLDRKYKDLLTEK